MRSIYSFKLQFVSVGAALLFSAGLILHAQSSQWVVWSPPYYVAGPVAPTQAEQCAKFSAEVNRYFSKIEQDHAACLRDNNADAKQDDALRSRPEVCDKRTCQSMHDYLYGSEARYRKKKYEDEVSDCYADVQSAQERQGHAAKRKEERDYAADQRAQERAVGDTQSRQRASGSPRPKNSDQKTGFDAQSSNSSANTPSPLTHGTARSKSVLADLADPFGESGHGRSVRPDIADPFSKGAESASDKSPDIENPFGHEASNNAEAIPGYVKEKALKIEEEFVHKGVTNAESVIERQLEDARKIYRGNELKIIEKEGEHASDFVKGLDTALTVVKYGKDLGDLAVAKDEREYDKAYSDLFIDLAKESFTIVVKRLSTRVGTFMGGPVALVIGSTFDSTETGRDPVEIINDNYGKYSYNDKEKALDSLMVQYEHHRDIWSKGQVQWLMKKANGIYSSPENPNIHLAPR